VGVVLGLEGDCYTPVGWHVGEEWRGMV
jgi:hypothetical protein